VHINNEFADLQGLANDLSDNPQSKITVETDFLITQETLQLLLRQTFDTLAPGWGVQDEEVKALSETWIKVVNKWLPRVGGEYKEEFAALASTLLLILPRLGSPRINRTPEVGNGE